ncbi:hypothetical protein SAMN05444374_11811 [Rhodococcoides kroppenstedtii]|uniref:Uncharacterized protein n=1 Tax=Rhodococcoides kroppenstedtii TaxID=293050 RepID=A0A1I0UC70_9NOCA|nr:hypothetical protein [Rhodococcus kroppenstedtii]SFA61510.1 hypothetical protein SAMN05444374_11811 [Rhodococcus kroppenstedtii]
MYATDILTNIKRAERVWPHNAHLLEHHRIEDYMRYALRYRDDAVVDGTALVPPLGLADDIHHDAVSYPFDDPAEMIAKMDMCRQRGLSCAAPAFVCGVCSRSIGDAPRKPNEFEIVWVSAPPSVVGVALCASCAPCVFAEFNPTRI